MNNDTLVAKRKDFLLELIDYTRSKFMKGVVAWYDDSKRQNNSHKYILRDFQLYLKKVPQWNEVKLQTELEVFRDEKFMYRVDTYHSICVVNSKLYERYEDLISLNRYDSRRRILNFSKFAHDTYIQIARELWRNPQLLYDHLIKSEYHKNLLVVQDIISQAIKTTCRQFTLTSGVIISESPLPEEEITIVTPYNVPPPQIEFPPQAAMISQVVLHSPQAQQSQTYPQLTQPTPSPQLEHLPPLAKLTQPLPSPKLEHSQPLPQPEISQSSPIICEHQPSIIKTLSIQHLDHYVDEPLEYAEDALEEEDRKVVENDQADAPSFNDFDAMLMNQRKVLSGSRSPSVISEIKYTPNVVLRSHPPQSPQTSSPLSTPSSSPPPSPRVLSRRSSNISDSSNPAQEAYTHIIPDAIKNVVLKKKHRLVNPHKNEKWFEIYARGKTKKI
jgi:hypothetical protein